MDRTRKFAKREDICHILRECAKSGVTHLKWEGLEVWFGETNELNPLGAPPRAKPPTEKVLSESLQVSKEQLETEELLSKEDRLDHMLIENPLEYENLMMAGELDEP